MKKLGLYLLYLISWLVVIWLHWSVVDVLPHPYDHINLTIIFSLILIIFFGNSRILWWLIIPLLIEELFTATSYGINAVAIFSALAFFNWCLQSVFVSRSLLIIWCMALATIFGYRFLLYLLLLFSNSTSIDILRLSGSEIGFGLIWELALTGITLIAVYVPMLIFIKKLRPEYIMVRSKEYGSKKYFY